MYIPGMLSRSRHSTAFSLFLASTYMYLYTVVQSRNGCNMRRPRALYRLGEPTTTLQRKGKSVEIWISSCIVTNFGKSLSKHSSSSESRIANNESWVLVNPANEGLSGCSNFPYFPRGGPVPEKPMNSSFHKAWQPLGYVSQWGGMEIGSGMLYPISVVDGLVHLHGGWRLQAELQLLKSKQKIADFCSSGLVASSSEQQVCPTGEALATGPGDLNNRYDHIVHTVPPFFKTSTEKDGHNLLALCYKRALNVAGSLDSATRIAMPLLGAGARGFSNKKALHVAAEAAQKWLMNESNDHCSSSVLVFALQEEKIAEQLHERFVELMERQDTTSVGKFTVSN